MTINSENEIAHPLNISDAVLRSLEIDLLVGTDFVEYKRIVSAERVSQEVGKPFDPDLVDLLSEDGFWLIGRNVNGVLIHTQACRLLAMRNRSLAEYMEEEFVNFPPSLPGIDFERSSFQATPGAHRINGRVAYHGEMWLAPEQNAYRGRGLSPRFIRAGLTQICERLNPDWIFGLIAQELASKGFTEQIGYFHNEPGAVRWFHEADDRPLEGFLCYLSREDIAYLRSRYVGD